MLAVVVLGLALPLTPAQILWVNMVTAVTLAIALFEFALMQGVELDVAGTMAVSTLVIAQMFYLFNARFLSASSLRFNLLFSNRAALIAVGVLAFLQPGFVYLPFMNLWFGSAALEPSHWLLPIGIGMVVFLTIEAEKAWGRRQASLAGKR